MRISCWLHRARHTLRMCNTYCFSTATMVTRTRLNVTLYLHRLYLYIYIYIYIYCWPWILLGFLLNDQLDAQFFSMYLFQFSTCFEQPRDHHQENQLYQYNIWYVSLCAGDLCVCSSERNFPTFTRNGHLHSDIYQMLYWYNWFSWWWAWGFSKHVENWNKHVENITFCWPCIMQWFLVIVQHDAQILFNVSIYL